MRTCAAGRAVFDFTRHAARISDGLRAVFPAAIDAKWFQASDDFDAWVRARLMRPLLGALLRHHQQQYLQNQGSAVPDVRLTVRAKNILNTAKIRILISIGLDAGVLRRRRPAVRRLH